MSTRMLTAMFCGLASVASAQTKISGTSHCNKPDVTHAVPAGDRPDHQFGLTKLKCTWSRPIVMAGAQMQQDEISVLSEINGNVSSDRAYVVGTLNSGTFAVAAPSSASRMRMGPLTVISSGATTFPSDDAARCANGDADVRRPRSHPLERIEHQVQTIVGGWRIRDSAAVSRQSNDNRNSDRYKTQQK